jgi:thiol-disulfide isomerase/thioredoxin
MKILNYLKANIGNVFFILFISVVFFSTDARAFLIRGLMFTGLFNAEASVETEESGSSKTIPPPMIFKSENGEIINTAERNGKVYFINFWATWCPPCRAEMPSINTLASKIKNKEKVEFIMVDVDAKVKSSVAYMKTNSFNLKVYTSESGIPENIFGGSLPTTAIIGPDGTLVFHHTGMADYNNQKMIDFLNTLSK